MLSDEGSGRFTLDELSEATDVPERTIRFYIEGGLLPPAAGRGRAAYYTSEHVRRLTHIADLRRQRYTLDEIRNALTSNESNQEAPGDIERWERVRLHPDLELLLRADAPEGIRALAAELRAAAARWLGDDA
jgi:DNA-binding transcriptional MerR regulator